jgi:UDP-N-acetylmuramyl pentapeptide phosphotransferase/UDP-N-acetylglucosamine-1-phosphate transferase
LAAGAATRAAANQIDGPPADVPQAWRRVNYRGRPVDIRGGLALATGLLAAAARPRPAPSPEAAWGAVAAIGVAAAAGWLDDLADDKSARGLRGHLGALRRGQLTTGLAKLVAITAGAAVFAGQRHFTGAWRGAGGPGARGLGRWRRWAGGLWRAGVDTALVAGAANLANLLDLRPGRSLKAAGASAALLAAGRGGGSDLAAGTLAAALAAAPADLAERAMLGDAGANALGAAVGVAAARSLRPSRRALAAATVAGLILASEKVSFSRVIAATPGLRWLDQLGRAAPGEGG